MSLHERFDFDAAPPLVLLVVPLLSSIEFRQFASTLFQSSITKKKKIFMGIFKKYSIIDCHFQLIQKIYISYTVGLSYLTCRM